MPTSPIFPQTFVETLREQIMDNVDAQIYVNAYADKCVRHFEEQADVILKEQVHEELFCQYQVQAWNKLFASIANR